MQTAEQSKRLDIFQLSDEKENQEEYGNTYLQDPQFQGRQGEVFSKDLEKYILEKNRITRF